MRLMAAHGSGGAFGPSSEWSPSSPSYYHRCEWGGGDRPPRDATDATKTPTIGGPSPSNPGESHFLTDDAMVLLFQLRLKYPGLDAAKCQRFLFDRFGVRVQLDTIRTFLTCLDNSRSSTRSNEAGVDEPCLSQTKPPTPLFQQQSTIEFHRLVPAIDPRRFKFCGEMGLHWLEIFKRGGTAAASSPSQPQFGPTTRDPQALCYYSLVAFMGVSSPGSPLSSPVLYDLSDEVLDARWFRKSLQAAVATQFFEKGDVLILDPRVIMDDDYSGNYDHAHPSFETAPSPQPPSLDEYLWNLVDPRDGQPLRLCLLWLPFASTSGVHANQQHSYFNPVKLLFNELLHHLHKYPLDRIRRPLPNPHVTAIVAKEWLASITADQVHKWCHQCGYGGATTSTPISVRRE